MKQIDVACYSLCLLSILAGAGVVIISIWGGIERDVCLKLLGSFGVMATACILVLGLNRLENLQTNSKTKE